MSQTDRIAAIEWRSRMGYSGRNGFTRSQADVVYLLAEIANYRAFTLGLLDALRERGLEPPHVGVSPAQGGTDGTVTSGAIRGVSETG